MRSGLGDSEIDSILQNVTSADEQSLLKPGRVGVAKKKPPGDQLTSPSKTKAAVTKDTKVLLEETKKVSYLFLSSSTFLDRKKSYFTYHFLIQIQLKAMNEQLIDKLENKCQLIDSLERDLNEARKRLSQRKMSLENGSRKLSLTKVGDDPKFAEVKDAVMKEPDMGPKQPSELGRLHSILI